MAFRKRLNLPIYPALGVSILGHLALFWVFNWGSSVWREWEDSKFAGAPEPLELTYAPSRQFVPAPKGDAPEQQSPPEEAPARFTSRDRQRVAQETQAAHKDYRASMENNPASNPTEPSQQPERVELRPRFWGMTTPEDPKVRFGPSTTLELPKVSVLNVDLPKDIELGSITVLNTDPLLHYSFFERFNQLSYHRWASEVNASLRRRTYRGQLVRSGSYSTEVSVILDRQGKVLDSQIHHRSGLNDFDQAFPKAVRLAGQIPNPPDDLIDPDGQVRLHFVVTVHVEKHYHSRN